MSNEWLNAVAPVLRPTFGVSGWHRCRGTGCSRRHRGMDFRARTPKPVFAVLSGTVLQSATTSGEAGQLITIEHAGGLVSRYMHLSKRHVSAGDSVAKGEQIADSGESGAPGRPHLHFDLLLPADQLAAWEALFGKPSTGFPKFSGDLHKVPVEPFVPIDAGNSHVFRDAKKLGIAVRQDDAVKALMPFTARLPILGGFSNAELIAWGSLTFAGGAVGGVIGRRKGRTWIGLLSGLVLGGFGGYLVARQVGEANDSECI